MFKFHLVILILCAANFMLIAVNGDENANKLLEQSQEDEFLADKIRYILIDPDFLALGLHQQMAVINVLRAVIMKNLEESHIRKENSIPSLPVLYKD
jgi:hypothetical protein